MVQFLITIVIITTPTLIPLLEGNTKSYVLTEVVTLPLVFHNNIRVFALVDLFSSNCISKRLSTKLGFTPCFRDDQVVSLKVMPYMYICSSPKLSTFNIRSNLTDFECIVGEAFVNQWQIAINYPGGFFEVNGKNIFTRLMTG